MSEGDCRFSQSLNPALLSFSKAINDIPKEPSIIKDLGNAIKFASKNENNLEESLSIFEEYFKNLTVPSAMVFFEELLVLSIRTTKWQEKNITLKCMQILLKNIGSRSSELLTRLNTSYY